MAGGQRWTNRDLQNIGENLRDNEAELPYLQEIRDRLELFSIPTSNRLIETFNVSTVEAFTAALSEWYNNPANSAFVIISTEFLKDANNTPFYMITYA